MKLKASMLSTEALLRRQIREKWKERHRFRPNTMQRVTNLLVTLDHVATIRLIRKHRHA